MEIERKFIIKNLPDSTEKAKYEIKQWYLSYTPEIRIREINGVYFLTEKHGDGLVREESETELEYEEAVKRIKKCGRKPVEKTRLIFPVGSHTADTDIYKGELCGLLTAEVEFKDIADAESFAAPAWFGREVTGDKQYKNSYLSKRINGES